MRKDTLLILVFMAGGIAVLSALGLWQVQRLAWKQDLIATIESRVALPPIALSQLAEGDMAQSEYRPVTLSGSFDHSGEAHFFATYKGLSGYHLYTPLRLDDPAGRIVFVNRGFVPFDRKEAQARPESLDEGKVEIEGLFRNRLEGKPSSLVHDNDPAANIYYWKDWQAMREAAGLGDEVLPFFVDARRDDHPDRLPVAGVTLIDLPNNHLQYAITWFGLAFALLGVGSYFLYARRERSKVT